MNPRDRRYVFDTNVLISSAALSLSKPRQAFEAAARDGILLVSTATENELLDVLERPKIRRYLTPDSKRRLLDDLAAVAKHIEPTEPVVACRDPKDDKFLELAVAGRAACIISGDEDLLALHPFRGIPILTPEQFLELFASES